MATVQQVEGLLTLFHRLFIHSIQYLEIFELVIYCPNFIKLSFTIFSDVEGLDYEHAVLAISRLARLHAVSYCYRQEKVRKALSSFFLFLFFLFLARLHAISYCYRKEKVGKYRKENVRKGCTPSRTAIDKKR